MAERQQAHFGSLIAADARGVERGEIGGGEERRDENRRGRREVRGVKRGSDDGGTCHKDKPGRGAKKVVYTVLNTESMRIELCPLSH